MSMSHHQQPPPPQRKPDWPISATILACGIVSLLLAAPSAAQLVLPAPSREPQAIDFAGDPLLGFLARAVAPEAFRQVIADAVASHPASGEAAAGTAAAVAARQQLRSGLFPTLNASIIASRSLGRGFENNSVIVESLAPRGRTDGQIGAEQLLFDFGATGGRIAGASARIRAARAEAGRSVTATTLDAVEAWYQLLGYQALTELSAALVERHRGILGDTRTRVAAGLGAGGDTVRAEAGLADAIADSARYARSLADIRARWRQVFGREAPLRPDRPALPASSAGDAAIAMAMSHSVPEVAIALAAAEALRAEARAVRGDALPRLSAGVGGTRYDAFNAGNNYDVRGQVVLRQSLSVGGAEAARTREVKARARAAEFAGDRVIAEAEGDAEAAFADARILDGSVSALADAYRANRRSRDTMAEQVRLSRGSLYDLLRAEQEYFAAAQGLLQGSVERDIARYRLLARTGELLPLFAIDPNHLGG